MQSSMVEWTMEQGSGVSVGTRVKALPSSISLSWVWYVEGGLKTKDRVKGYVVLVLNKLKGGLTTFQLLEKFIHTP
jgi:hypothetical protein